MHSLLSRTISFLLAIILSSLVLLLPQTLTNQDGSVNHSLLMLLMFGIMIGFIHGVGFQIKTSLIRYLIGPIMAWPLLIGGLLYIISKTGILW